MKRRHTVNFYELYWQPWDERDENAEYIARALCDACRDLMIEQGYYDEYIECGDWRCRCWECGKRDGD